MVNLKLQEMSDSDFCIMVTLYHHFTYNYGHQFGEDLRFDLTKKQFSKYLDGRCDQMQDTMPSIEYHQNKKTLDLDMNSTFDGFKFYGAIPFAKQCFLVLRSYR